MGGTSTRSKVRAEMFRKSQNATEWWSQYAKLLSTKVIFSLEKIGKLQSYGRFGSHWLEMDSFSEVKVID
jgi:hypothetical protein